MKYSGLNFTFGVLLENFCNCIYWIFKELLCFSTVNNYG